MPGSYAPASIAARLRSVNPNPHTEPQPAHAAKSCASRVQVPGPPTALTAVWRATHGDRTPGLVGHLPRLAENLNHQARCSTTTGPGLLDGAAGTALALHTAAPNSG